jgi:hypothetical protein
VKRISTFICIFLVHAIGFSTRIHAQAASSPIASGSNEISTAVPPAGSPSISVISYGAKGDGDVHWESNLQDKVDPS